MWRTASFYIAFSQTPICILRAIYLKLLLGRETLGRLQTGKTTTMTTVHPRPSGQSTYELAPSARQQSVSAHVSQVKSPLKHATALQRCRMKGNVCTHASLCPSGILASTLLMSKAPNPVAVRLCLARLKSGPMGPLSSEIGALVEGLRSLAAMAAA